LTVCCLFRLPATAAYINPRARPGAETNRGRAGPGRAESIAADISVITWYDGDRVRRLGSPTRNRGVRDPKIISPQSSATQFRDRTFATVCGT